MSRAKNAAAREHPVIVELRRIQAEVEAEGEWLAGAEFADERGALSGEDRALFEHTLAERKWKAGAWIAHEQRVRLDHAKLFSMWISGEVGQARRAKRGYWKWRAIRGRYSPWRLDVVEPPADESTNNERSELEHKRWRVSEVRTGRVVLERRYVDDATSDEAKKCRDAATDMYVEYNKAFIRCVDGRVEEVELVC